MYIVNLLFSMSGRMNRMTYFLMSLIVGVLGYSLAFGFELASSINPEQSTSNGTLIVLVFSLYVQTAMLTKRIRDTGSSTALVWIYFVGMLLGFPLILFGILSTIALLVGMLLLGVTALITLYAIFAGSSPDGKESKTGLSFSDPSANSEGQQAHNANADAIIAKAVAERREAQHSAGEPAQNPSHYGDGKPQQQSGFGKRPAPAFGHR